MSTYPTVHRHNTIAAAGAALSHHDLNGLRSANNAGSSSHLSASAVAQRSYAQSPIVLRVDVPGVVTIATQDNPAAVAVNRNSDKYYIANRTNNSVTVVDGRSNEAKNIAVGIDPVAIAISRKTDKIYVATNTGDIAVIDGHANSVMGTILTSTPMNAIIVNPVTNLIYALGSSEPGTVSVIAGASNAVIATLAVGAYPSAIAINIITNQIYVLNQFSDSVTVIDGHSNIVVDTIVLRKGAKPRNLVIDSGCNKIYVANAGSPGFGISIIDGSTHLVRNVAVGCAFDLAFNAASNKLYVATLNFTDGQNAITVVNANSEMAEAVVPMPCFSSSVRLDAGLNKIYVANQAADTLSVINGSNHAVTDTLPTGRFPIAIAVNPITHRVAVANFNSASISLIAQASAFP